jgi:hypothetical protein
MRSASGTNTGSRRRAWANRSSSSGTGPDIVRPLPRRYPRAP